MNQNIMHYNGDIQMADINQKEREEFQALIHGYGQGPRSFTANAGIQSSPVGGLTPVGQAIGSGIETVSNIAKAQRMHYLQLLILLLALKMQMGRKRFLHSGSKVMHFKR